MPRPPGRAGSPTTGSGSRRWHSHCRPKAELRWVLTALVSLGIDPDGLPWADAYEAALMAESARRVPPRVLWIEEYRDEDTVAGLDAAFGPA